ncbi:efflux RND transporter permease subunit [Sedimenticola selenatireducens]|uniref:Efflux RND transporter permease subunit n=1 Tax=Sedimenticola selenatireducens TaxID=191960 RepID=A0A558DKI5_9GAMM|nr:efflux RND transporter permease subunit [Sedimenticola selenatireducens]TVO71205.1 efflux RND transporter permease subunit [Sedimenticola selenatireducens]TVT61507.1 MAG: efflux RND transporter permease subunit [Sedimenticola selenatireducens]
MIAYFVRHPTAANLLMVALMILGLVTLPKLQRDTFPIVPPTEVEVRIPYPGATPAEVEEGICLRSEEALDTLSQLREVRCDARENLAILTVQIEEGGDMDAFHTDVKAQIESIATFPDKVETPAIEVLERVAVVAGVMITGELKAEDLKAYAEQVKTRFKLDRRIAQVRILGFSEQEIVIEIPAEVQQRYSLGIAQIKSAIERQSIDLPAGTVQSDEGDLVVRFAEQRRTPREFRDLVLVSGQTGGVVRLGDVATIRTAFEKAEEKILFNGRRGALLEISKNYTQDSLRVMDAIQENLQRERGMAPRGVQLEISQDVTSNIRDRLRILLENGLQGLVLVFLTLWAFFSLRYSFWVAMGLPVSFLGAIFFMHLFGYTLNMMTMVALLVAIGLLMDDAIVISENIAAQIRKGRSTLEAAVEGTRQVLPGVLSSFLTTVMVVGPLAFMAGKMGEVLKYIPAVLVIALAVSLIEAFLILPAHLHHSLGHLARQRRSSFHTRFDRWFSGVQDRRFGPLLERAVRQPYLTAGLLLGLVILSFAMIPAGVLKYRALPVLESDVIQARVLLPQGTPLRRTEAVVQRLVTELKALDETFSGRQKGGTRLVKNVSILFNTNADAQESGPHLATVSADLLAAEERVGTIPEMLDDWRERVGELPDVLSLKFTDRERGVAGKAIDIRLQGSKPEMLKQASLELQHWLGGFRGVLDLSDDLRPGKPELRIRLREVAGSLGVSARDIADEVRAAIHGATDLDVRIGSSAYDVVVRLAAADIIGIDDLHYLPVRSQNGQLVPLSAVAEIQTTRGFSRIHRVNGQRTVTIQGALDTEVANAQELMGITKAQFLPEMKQKYPGVRVAFVGQGKESATTGSSLQTNILIGLVGVFIILSFQFRSYLQPIAVLLAIPTGLIGVVWGHLLMGLELSMPSLVGLATLTGIVVNDSILLVSFIKEKHASGMVMIEAVQLAAHDRFRAIILTSITTIVGLLPLLLESSTQAQFLIPLVASLAFGLLSATVLSLFLLPACFVIFEELDWFKRTNTEVEQLVDSSQAP